MNDTLLSLGRILFRGALAFGLTAATIGAAYASGLVYAIDQQDGTIEFSTIHFGLFSSGGRFNRFTGNLDLDLVHPQYTSFRFSIDATSVAMPLAPEAAIVRGPEFFDVAHYPLISYVSKSVARVADRQYVINGVLEVRSVARPQLLDAVLLERRTDNQRHVEIADFAVTGRLRRSDFGMVANQAFISDTVTLSIHLRVELPAAPDSEGSRTLQSLPAR
jgi:polyisoprenoid-binding protein YceI